METQQYIQKEQGCMAYGAHLSRSINTLLQKIGDGQLDGIPGFQCGALYQ